jgi:hypothetical protein
MQQSWSLLSRVIKSDTDLERRLLGSTRIHRETQARQLIIYGLEINDSSTMFAERAAATDRISKQLSANSL